MAERDDPGSAASRPRRASSCRADGPRATPRAGPSASRCPRRPAARRRTANAPPCGSARTSSCCWRRRGKPDACRRNSVRRCRDLAHSLVDVSQRQAGLAVDGPRARDLIASGCPLDLDPESFPVGMCARTLFAKAEVVLWRRERRGVPSGSRAFLRGLCPRLDARSESVGLPVTSGARGDSCSSFDGQTWAPRFGSRS